MLPPTAPKKLTVVGWIISFALLTGMAWRMVTSVPTRWAIGLVTSLFVVMTILDRYRLKRIKHERKEESICSFARQLPAKHHDTWIVRAVYEELSRELGAPLRPTDDVTRFWHIDPDELDEIAFRIAHRAGRSMDDTKNNPMFDRVVTIQDMIFFFEHQPRLPNKTSLPTGMNPTTSTPTAVP